MSNSPVQLYSVAECAEFLSVSAKTVWRLIYARKITSVRVGRRVLISDRAIEEFVESAQMQRLDTDEFVRRILS